MKTRYHEQDGLIRVEHYDDIEPHLKAAHEMRSAKVRTEKIGDWHHAMRVPNVIMMKIMDTTGLSFFNKEDWPEIWKILKRDYPQFKTTPHSL